MSACLAVIPARGGSKRIPGKNIRMLLGRPLIAYTIEAAHQSGIFQRVVVSTDSPEIAAIAKEQGAEIPFMRRAELADDHTPVSQVTADALNRLDPNGEIFTHVAQLMPNCPLRTAEDVRASYRHFVEAGIPAQISISSYGWLNPWWALRRDDLGRLQALFSDEMKARSQDLEALYCPSGAIWWANTEALRREKSFYMPGYDGWEIGWQNGVDIDTQEDWLAAEQFLLGRLAGGRD